MFFKEKLQVDGSAFGSIFAVEALQRENISKLIFMMTLIFYDVFHCYGFFFSIQHKLEFSN